MTRPLVVALHLRVAMMNVPTKVRAAAWERCFLLLVRRADIFGINEAGSPRAKRLYRSLATAQGYKSFGLFGPNPVFWNDDVYEFVDGRQIKLHGKDRGWRARRWPGFNAARYATEVVLRHRKTGRLIVVLNWHMVAPGRKVRARWRNRMRVRSMDRIETIATYHVGQRRIFVGIGDANRDAWAIPGLNWLHRNGPDLIGIAVPRGLYIDRADTDVFPAPTDHKHGKSADIELVGDIA